MVFIFMFIYILISREAYTRGICRLLIKYFKNFNDFKDILKKFYFVVF